VVFLETQHFLTTGASRVFSATPQLLGDTTVSYDHYKTQLYSVERRVTCTFISLSL